MSQTNEKEKEEPKINGSTDNGLSESDRSIVDTLLELILPAAMVIHLLIAPYTKVEESFNMQAIHDVAMVGFPMKDVSATLQKYDHFEFPGVVPRSFVGAAILGGLATPILAFIKEGLIQQIIVRALLGLFNCYAMIVLSRKAAGVYSRGTARWYLLLQASQFHVMYYASRTLPNMFAFGMVTYALAELMPPPRSLAARKDWFDTAPIGLQILIIAGVIFRCELAVLFFTTLIPLIATGWVSIYPELLILGPVTGIFGLFLAVPVDTYFWQTWPKPMWAELEGFWFNTVQGKSSEWGVSPFYYYFLNSIPKMMLNPIALLVLLPLGLKAGGWKRTTERIVGPALAFVAIYSVLPHKEWRFIVYVMPALTLVAGGGADWLFTRRSKSFLYTLGNLILISSIFLTFAASFAMSWISSLNYPGGEALKVLEQLAGDRERLTIHMDVQTCMTGATRFTQNNVKHPNWQYLKDESPAVLTSPAFWNNVDYELTANPMLLVKFFPGWEVKARVKGYAGVGIWHPGVDGENDIFIGGRRLARELVRFSPGSRWPVVKMRDMIYILARKGIQEVLDGFEDVDLTGKEDREILHNEL